MNPKLFLINADLLLLKELEMTSNVSLECVSRINADL
jgi:hypothetical protein